MYWLILASVIVVAAPVESVASITVMRSGSVPVPPGSALSTVTPVLAPLEPAAINGIGPLIFRTVPGI
ncbi:hypothetical protein D3C75_725020 [compost metagenome]